MAKLIKDNCLVVMKNMESGGIDLTVTSPPYDNLRSYNGNNELWCEHVWKEIISELYRVTKIGGVVVWVVGDKTKNGSETGSSFKQAIHAISCGFNLHDTMIFRKKNALPQNHRRYEQDFEYMFIFTKGKIGTFNPVKIETVNSGNPINWHRESKTDDLACRHNREDKEALITKKTKTKGNVWEYAVGGIKTGHPASFPIALVSDHVKSWSNECDVVFDPFMGSGTTGIACKKLNRDFIGIELDDQYFEIAKKRIDES